MFTSIKTISAVLIILSLKCFNVFAGDEILELGEHLHNSGYYQESITEYKRYIHFHKDSEFLSVAYYKMGLAYRQDDLWEQSLIAFRSSINNAKNETTRDNIRISLAATLLATARYSAANLELLKISVYSDDENLKSEANYLRGISCLYKYDWDEARKALNESNIFGFRKKHKEDPVYMDSFFNEIGTKKLKSQKKAVFLSTIIPGLGQVYADDWKNGINAFLLNFAIGLLATRLIIDGNHEDGLISFLFFLRYYIGNRYTARKSTLEYNEKINKYYSEKGLRLLSKQ